MSQKIECRRRVIERALSVFRACGDLTRCADLPKSPFAFREIIQSLPKSELIEVRPESIHEAEFGISALPQQEVAQSFLPAGANQQIHVRRYRHRMIHVGKMLLEAGAVHAGFERHAPDRK